MFLKQAQKVLALLVLVNMPEMYKVVCAQNQICTAKMNFLTTATQKKTAETETRG